MPAHHILVPTDFSADADYALEYGIRLAKKLQAKLTLLYDRHKKGGRGRSPDCSSCSGRRHAVPRGAATR